MYQKRIGIRAEHLQEQHERVSVARSLAEEFPQLRTLTATLSRFSPDGLTCCSELKCTFNLGYAKALFLLACPNPECVGGNFDLSLELARAVAGHQQSTTGESRCQGWKNKATVGSIYCDHLLRYTLQLAY